MPVNWIDVVVMYDLFKGYWLKSLAIGFWFIAVGYYFLLFAYIFFYRFLLKETKLFYWFVFSLFFLFLGIGRVSNIVYDFYVPNSFYDQLGVGVNWFSIGCLAAIAGIMLIDNDKVSNLVAALIAIPPIIIGFIYPFIPAESLAAGSILYILFNTIILPAYGILVMSLFVYLAIQIPGDIRKKSILNTIGFLILFIGRGIYSKGARAVLGLPGDLVSIIASSLVVLSLIIFAFSTR
ncbi:MAG: hypothetical protein ACFFCM_08375 [Promethearchaeota archaeon]